MKSPYNIYITNHVCICKDLASQATSNPWLVLQTGLEKPANLGKVCIIHALCWYTMDLKSGMTLFIR